MGGDNDRVIIASEQGKDKFSWFLCHRLYSSSLAPTPLGENLPFSLKIIKKIDGKPSPGVVLIRRLQGAARDFFPRRILGYFLPISVLGRRGVACGDGFSEWWHLHWLRPGDPEHFG